MRGQRVPMLGAPRSTMRQRQQLPPIQGVKRKATISLSSSSSTSPLVLSATSDFRLRKLEASKRTCLLSQLNQSSNTRDSGRAGLELDLLLRAANQDSMNSDSELDSEMSTIINKMQDALDELISLRKTSRIESKRKQKRDMERYKRIISGPMQKSHDLGVDIHFARVKMNTDGLSNREQIFPPLARHEDTEYAKENKRKQKHLLPPTSNRYGMGITNGQDSSYLSNLGAGDTLMKERQLRDRSIRQDLRCQTSRQALLLQRSQEQLKAQQRLKPTPPEFHNAMLDELVKLPAGSTRISTLRDRWLALFKELGFSVSQPKTISNHLSTLRTTGSYPKARGRSLNCDKDLLAAVLADMDDAQDMGRALDRGNVKKLIESRRASAAAEKNRSIQIQSKKTQRKQLRALKTQASTTLKADSACGTGGRLKGTSTPHMLSNFVVRKGARTRARAGVPTNELASAHPIPYTATDDTTLE